MKAELCQALERSSPFRGEPRSCGITPWCPYNISSYRKEKFGKAETVKPQLPKAAIAKKSLTKKQGKLSVKFVCIMLSSRKELLDCTVTEVSVQQREEPVGVGLLPVI